MNAAMFVVLSLLAESTGPSASPEAKAKAQALLSEGAQLFERGSMAKALERFNQAYKEFPSPKLLFNIGQTNRNLGRMVEAINAFENFLAKAPDAPADMIAEAKRSMAEISSVVGRLSVECSTVGAEVSLDGTSVGFAPLTDPLWVMPGNHLVTARHPSYTSATATVDIDPGTVHTVVMSMQPNPHASAPLPTSGNHALLGQTAPAGKTRPAGADLTSADLQALPGDAGSGGRSGFWLGRKWAWVASAGAVAFAGAAVGFGLSMQSKFDGLNGSCGSSSAGYQGCSDDDISSVTWRRNTANVLWGLTAAAAATAGVLFIVEGRRVSVTPVAGESVGLIAATSY